MARSCNPVSPCSLLSTQRSLKNSRTPFPKAAKCSRHLNRRWRRWVTLSLPGRVRVGWRHCLSPRCVCEQDKLQLCFVEFCWH